MVIFLGGAHGVGKSYLASSVPIEMDVQHLTASQLIREEKGYQSWSDDRRVPDAEVNQELLIAAVRRRIRSSGHLLLDGHFVLRGADGQLIRLPPDVFARLHVGAVILLEASSEILAQRLKERTGTTPNLEDLAALAMAEREHAQLVSSILRVPFTRLVSPTEQEFVRTLQLLVMDA